ncbi:MAG: hypothetical protein CNLJKLNK_00263 [Holosporales bacterium]
MKYIYLLFTIFAALLNAATPEESRQNLNSLLQLDRFPKVIFESRIETPLEIFFSCKKVQPIGAKLPASSSNRMMYKGVVQTQEFTVDDHSPVIAICKETLNRNTVVYPFVNYIRTTNPKDVFFHVEYDEENDFKGTTTEIRITIRNSPIFLLKMPRFDFLRLSALDIDKYDYIEFFKNHVIPTFGSYTNYYTSLQQDYNRFLDRQREIPHSADFRIPLNIFTIWLTNPSNPKGLSDASTKLIKETHDNCSSAFGWTHYLCVHRISDNPSITQGKNVIELSILMNEPDYSRVKAKYEAALDMRNYGMASDIARLVVLHKFGGIYQDTDVAIMQSPKRLHQLCDFYAGIESPKALAPGNAIMAAKTRHPIICKYLDFIANGCDDLRLPEHLKDPVRRTLFETGPYALARAYFSARTEWDVMLPPHIFYFPPFMRKENCPAPRDQWPLCTIARHEHAMEWLKFE